MREHLAHIDAVAKASASSTHLAATVVASLPLDDLDELALDVIDDLRDVRLSAGSAALAQLGVSDDGELVDQVSTAAVEQARARAAEMVGKRFNAAGDLVDNPDARWRIDEATRDMVRDAIASGLDDNIGLDGIVDLVMATGAFSEERADLIARTEVSIANSAAALDGYTIARDDAGVDVRKEWLTAGDDLVDEDICVPNEEAGPIDLDEPFPSGHMTTPGHPNCRCSISPVVAEADIESDDESDLQ